MERWAMCALRGWPLQPKSANGGRPAGGGYPGRSTPLVIRNLHVFRVQLALYPAFHPRIPAKSSPPASYRIFPGAVRADMYCGTEEGILAGASVHHMF